MWACQHAQTVSQGVALERRGCDQVAVQVVLCAADDCRGVATHQIRLNTVRIFLSRSPALQGIAAKGVLEIFREAFGATRLEGERAGVGELLRIGNGKVERRGHDALPRTMQGRQLTR